MVGSLVYIFGNYAGLYQCIFPDASLYYVLLIALAIISVLVSGICLVTLVVYIANFIGRIFTWQQTE